MKKSIFKKSLLIYFLVLIILTIVFLGYVYFTLKTYEANELNNFLENYIASIDDETLKKYLKDANLSEDNLEAYKKQLNSENLKLQKKSEDVFEATLNKQPILTIETEVVKDVTKLGLFTYQERKIVNVKPNLSRGLYFVDVTIPSNYKLYVNDKLITDQYTEENYLEVAFLNEYEVMPKVRKYTVNNLVEKADVRVEDFKGNEVELINNNDVYSLKNNYIESPNYEDASKYLDGEVNVLDIAHTWSLFLSRDLKGTRYGLNTVNEFLIPYTNLYKMAYNWATNIDIRFISKHTLKNPIWTNEKVSNFKIYSDKVFSCDVYTEKNMIVKNKDQVDVMNDTLYFVKVDNEWKLLEIKSVVEDKNE